MLRVVLDVIIMWTKFPSILQAVVKPESKNNKTIQKQRINDKHQQVSVSFAITRLEWIFKDDIF